MGWTNYEQSIADRPSAVNYPPACPFIVILPMKIISGTAHRVLAERIAECLGQPLADVHVSAFPDGETEVKINENVRGADVFIIQPSCPPTNHNLMELLIMVDAARRASAERITAVMPFFGYARQDRKDQPRVPITAKLVANLLTSAGVNRVLTMDLHAPQIQGFFDIPVDHLYAKSVLIGYLRERHPDTSNLTVVSPDVGGVKMARAYADALGAELAIVAKHRVSATRVEAMNVIGEVEGRDVLLVDDMTETAGTLPPPPIFFTSTVRNGSTPESPTRFWVISPTSGSGIPRSRKSSPPIPCRRPPGRKSRSSASPRCSAKRSAGSTAASRSPRCSRFKRFSNNFLTSVLQTATSAAPVLGAVIPGGN